MRNISFMLTTSQFLDGSKDVTRRLGWKNLKEGDHLMGCEKCQGLKQGEKLNRLGEIVVVSAILETLEAMIMDPGYGRVEAIREGFPGMTGAQFVEMFCKHMRCESDHVVTRIEFRHVGEEAA